MPVTYFVRMTATAGNEDAVRDLLLSNVRRIQEGERGNLAFAVHRALDDPRTFWLYETWADEAAVEAHESGPAFTAYKDALRPLVEPDSLLFGNAEPLAALGYGLGAAADG
jgi:quinol monooxygenase YgiN